MFVCVKLLFSLVRGQPKTPVVCDSAGTCTRALGDV